MNYAERIIEIAVREVGTKESPANSNRVKYNGVGIYKITSPSGKTYIGQSTNCEKRYLNYLYGKCVGQIRLYNSIKKYGFKAHRFEIIVKCDPSMLNYYESFYAKFYNSNSQDFGLNIRECGANPRHSEETKLKISKALKGHQSMSIEARIKLRERMLGEKRTPESLLKAKETRSKRVYVQTSESNQKRSISMKGRVKSKDLIERHKASLRDWYVKKINYRVMCVDTNEIFETAFDAFVKYGINRSNITSVIKGRAKTAGGKKWIALYKN